MLKSVQCYVIYLSKFSVLPRESHGINIRGDFFTLALYAFKQTCINFMGNSDTGDKSMSSSCSQGGNWCHEVGLSLRAGCDLISLYGNAFGLF